VRAFELSGGEACHDSQQGGGNGNGETRKAAHLESGARDLYMQGTGARAAEGTQGAANRATLGDISPSEGSCNFTNGETLVIQEVTGRRGSPFEPRHPHHVTRVPMRRASAGHCTKNLLEIITTPSRVPARKSFALVQKSGATPFDSAGEGFEYDLIG
jgi:hypothetical protein